ncbi:MAG TPA: hypothetical protein VK932_01450 [Kofleriaceae bacterium]|nr:hypothetical protein [Kofleriaceae bacterium]
MISRVHRQGRSGIYGAMEFSVPRRLSLFADDPVAELRGLGSLTDPDDDVAAVIDLAVIGARGDGKTQFIVHAIRALHAHAPALDGAEQRLNQDVMRLVLDPRATRPDATPPGVVPHFTFRVRAAGLLDRLRGMGAVRLAWRAGRVGLAVVLAVGLAIAGVVVGVRGEAAAGVAVGASGALIGAIAALVSRRRIASLGDVEVVFWDIAGEQVYSAAAADYYTLLGRLVDARRRRADACGRAYAFVPVLICNPLALGTDDEGSPYERLRELLPLFAALDRDAARALIAINRWSVVDPICARGALRDELVTVTACARGEEPSAPRAVSREQVRAHCLDAEDGRDKGVRMTYLRYDTAIRAGADVDAEGGSLAYEFDDGPGAFSGDARYRFLDWIVGLVRWPRMQAPAPAPAGEAVAVAPSATASTSVPALALGSLDPTRASGPIPAPVPIAAPAAAAAAPAPVTATPPIAAPTPIPRESPYAAPAEIWSRPLDAPGPR